MPLLYFCHTNGLTIRISQFNWYRDRVCIIVPPVVSFYTSPAIEAIERCSADFVSHITDSWSPAIVGYYPLLWTSDQLVSHWLVGFQSFRGVDCCGAGLLVETPRVAVDSGIRSWPALHWLRHGGPVTSVVSQQTCSWFGWIWEPSRYNNSSPTSPW